MNSLLNLFDDFFLPIGDVVESEIVVVVPQEEGLEGVVVRCCELGKVPIQ